MQEKIFFFFICFGLVFQVASQLILSNKKVAKGLKVIFLTVQKYCKSNSITGFGFCEDESLGSYVSESEGMSKEKYLHKLLEGTISLFEERLDRNTVRTEYSINVFGQPSTRRGRNLFVKIFFI